MTIAAPPEQIASLLEQDRNARADALDVHRSFLVQAPAGSGKTQLLTQRLLALLSVVDKPEEVLAITFTKAATAEMRSRVMDELQKARPLLDLGVTEGDEFEKHKHAIAALERSHKLGWSLLEQPQRLNIQTIDSLCRRIAHDFPLLSRLGGQLQPTEDVVPLYALAARRTIERLGGSNEQLSKALERLLRLRDVNLANCETLIAEMLGERDQWLEEFSLARSLSEEEWAKLRTRREEPLRREHDRIRSDLKQYVSCEPDAFRRLLDLAAYACSNEPTEAIHGLAALSTVDQLEELAHFSCVRTLLMTQKNAWRKNADKDLGFPPEKSGGSGERKKAFQQLVADLSRIDGLREALNSLDSIPNPAFTEEEWQTIRGIFTVLLRASAELRVVFAERSVIDFVELGLTAELALREPEVRRRWSTKLRHLLVDEFQDTSRRQYTLLKEIISGWDDPTEGRTCFLVGDPMQSIYLFRNAELALFDEVQQHGFGKDVPNLHFTLLTLSSNFRSNAGIVEPINAMFDDSRQRGLEGATRFTPALADPKSSSTNAMHLHASFLDDATDKNRAAQDEADAAVNIIRSHLPEFEQARADGKPFRIGVLVKIKQQVARIAEALRDAGIPYRAVEIETLGERQEIRDLLSLMRALLHPMDRIAWLSVLRAPWCGLSLADLHILSGSDDQKLQKRTMRELLAQRIGLLSEDGQPRARRVQQILETALARRLAGSFGASPHGFSAWVERTWIALGGPQCIDANAYENAQTLFRLLAKFKPSGLEASGAAFDKRLEKLFAQPDPCAPENCSVQLMTIHKAKGLGFDVVLLPGLERDKTKDDTPLLRWMVRTREGTAERELLMAPIGAKGGKTSATYKWLGRLKKRDELAEHHRLLYVACTRARTDLHLFAALKVKDAGTEIADPSSGSLLSCGWEYLQQSAQEQFVKYLATRTPSPAANGVQLVPSRAQGGVLEIAAATEIYVQDLKRLPASWTWTTADRTLVPEMSPSNVDEQPRQRRGGLASRARGVVLHAAFESLAALPESDPRRDVKQSLTHWKAVATAMLHHAGLSRRELNEELKTILAMLQAAAVDPHAQWILRQRPHASSEVAWTVVDEDGTRIVRCDRAFIAGADPLSEGRTHLWIVDYKTADGEDSFLLDEQKRYEPQLQGYAAALREATQSDLPVRLALYYPALPRLLWWPA
jgi:ATP-dependent exoDNAse (exonuclease V) beta subunit